jgi:hypothetical protein
VTKPGVRVVAHYFLAASGDEVKTLAVSDKAVDFAKQLHNAAATHPEYFVQPWAAGTRIVLDKRVSLEDSGVFVRGKRVADLQEFIVTISRHEIDSGTATVSTVPIGNQLSVSTKILIGCLVAIAASMVYAAVMLSNGMD